MPDMRSCFLFVFAPDFEGLVPCLGFLLPGEPFRDSSRTYMYIVVHFRLGLRGRVRAFLLRRGGLLCCGVQASRCSGFSFCGAQTPGHTGFGGCGARAGSSTCDCQDFLFSVRIVMKLELLDDFWGPSLILMSWKFQA